MEPKKMMCELLLYKNGNESEQILDISWPKHTKHLKINI